MPAIDTESQFKFLIACIKHSSAGKVNFNAVAEELQIVSKAAAAKRYERLMKSHGVNPSGGGSTTPTDPATPKGKGKAKTATPAKTPKSAAKKRKLAEFKDEGDDEEDIKPDIKKLEGEDKIDLKSIKDFKDVKDKKSLSNAEKFDKWIDAGSLLLRSIPEAPRSMLDAMERQDGNGGAAVAIECDDDDACIVVGSTDLASGTTVGTVPVSSGSRRETGTPASMSMLPPPPTKNSSPITKASIATLPAPSPLSTLTSPMSFDYTANPHFSPQTLTSTLMSSNSHPISGPASSNNNGHARASPISPTTSSTTHQHHHSSPHPSSSTLASWANLPAPQSYFWNLHQDSTGTGDHHRRS